MMNRREFLTWVLGASAAAIVLPKIELLGSLEPALVEPVRWDGTFAAIHKDAFRIYREKMAAYGLPVLPQHIASSEGDKLGHAVCAGIVLTDQCSVALDPLDLEGAIHPAMQALAEHAAYRGIDRYGALEIGMPGVEYSSRCGALRMLKAYSPYDDRCLVRFDLIGGCSDPRGHHQRRLKREIGQRLSRGHARPMLPA